MIQSAKTRPGADCGSDHQLLDAKFRVKLKKLGRTTRPFRYDLNQIPYDYTVEVMTDWFKIGKEVQQGCILSPCLFILYAEYIMGNATFWKAYKLESKLLGEISTTSNMQVIPL